MRDSMMAMRSWMWMMMGAAMLTLLVMGCSLTDSPTASQATAETEGNFWNPQPGDQIVPGREVPLVREGYWENLYGNTVNPALARARAIIGPAGGILALGPHLLTVPPGAVSANVSFSMAFASQTGIAVDCYPSPMSFAVPVMLSLSVRGTQYDGDDDSQIPDLRMFYMHSDGSLEEMPSDVDQNNLCVVGEIDHFSRYIIG